MSERKSPKYDRFELERELRELDEKLAELLARRAQIASKLRPQAASQVRRKKWQELERDLWHIWERTAQEQRSDVRSWRKMFSLVQELSVEEGAEGSGRAYVLAPRKEPAQVDCNGPTCTLTARLWAVLAAQSKQPLHVHNKLFNDPVIELIKALNQAGASLYWDELGMHSRGKNLATFSDGVIYAGEHSQNLLLLMALCLGRAGSARFTGGAGLKLVDLSPLRGFFPLLGARLAFVHPGSSSVPVRFESSGVLPEVIKLPDTLPAHLAAQLALALCIASPSYANGLHLEWGASHEECVAPVAANAVSLLQACGLNAYVETGKCVVPSGDFQLPENPELPLDPYLSAAILAIPAFAGGSAVLHGRWPGDLPQWKGAQSLLLSAGLDVSAEANVIRSMASESGPRQEIELALAQEFLPLAVALASKQAIASRHAARIRLPLAEERELAPSVEMAAMLGVELVWDGDIYTLRQTAQDIAADETFVAPDGRWGPAAALASFSRPGFKLANPGIMSELMPGFWKFFNGLPDPGREAVIPRVEPKKEEDNGRKSTRRRIRT